MTSIDSNDRPRRKAVRWLRRFGIGALALALIAISASWLRGQDQWGPFSGQLVDEETGAPIAGANVMVSWDRRLPTPTGDGGRSFLYAAESVTDNEGRFELTGRPPFWELFATRPGFGYFAPAYLPIGRAVTPGGVPFVDPTVVTMRPLKTREERCRRRPSSPLHGDVPLFLNAVRSYRLGLGC